MIRQFTSAQFVPANAGTKAKNPVGSTLFSTPMVALLRHPGHKILRTSCHESARKRLTSPRFVGSPPACAELLQSRSELFRPSLKGMIDIEPGIERILGYSSGAAALVDAFPEQ